MAPSMTPPPPDISYSLSNVRSALSSAKDVAQDHRFTYHEHALAIQTTDEPIDTPKSSKSSKSSKSRSRLRTSDASEFGEFQHTPGSLTADLSHYKELFSKLRFSYLETITKEKYLRGIIEGEPVYENHEIEEFEKDLESCKKELGVVKQEMVHLVEQIEIVAAILGPESEDVNKKLEELERLPQELEEVNAAIYAELPDRETYNESLNLPLDQTLALVRDLELELSSINRNLTTLNSEIPRKQRITEQLDKDLKRLEMEQEELVGQATQAREMREKEQEMGRADRENMGRWYKATNEALNQLVRP